MDVNNIINRVSKYDTNLAKEISRYLNSRKYGLVYEESKPEFVSLPNKEVVRGDLVNILPPRKSLKDETKGKNNKGKSKKNKDKKKTEKDEDDNKKHKRRWRVVSLNKKNNKATLLSLEKDQTTVTANYDDLVAISRFDQPIYTGLKEVDRVERGGNKPFNIVINSENFHALETLMYAYYGKIDCIYIDPPYNTGAKDWKYNNNYVRPEDMYRHSKWLTFMEDRLKLAKRLLNPRNSTLIVTIDEKEVSRLHLLLQSIFPEADIEMVTSVINRRGKQRVGKFARLEEYIFFVKLGAAVINQENDPNFQEGELVPWRTLRRSNRSASRGNTGTGACGPNQFFPIYVNQKGKIVDIGKSLPLNVKITDIKPPKDCFAVFPLRKDGTEMNWGVTDSLAKELWKKGYIHVGKYQPDNPQKWVISYLTSGKIDAIESGKAKIIGHNTDGSVKAVYISRKKRYPASVWNKPSHNAETEGTNVLKSIFHDKRFPYPKSLYAVFDCLNDVIGNNPNALVLDFFAGSGTTLHAVNLLNRVDSGQRQCICVTNNELSSEEAEKLTEQKLRPGDVEWEKLGIAKYVTWPRVKSVINGKDIKGQPLQDTYDYKISTYVPWQPADVDKKGRKKLFVQKKQSMYPELANMKYSDGFKENAIFFDLDYLEPSAIKANLAFNEIAPLLWMKAGSKGRIIRHKSSYDITGEYAVLFNYKYVGKFTRQLKQHPEVKMIFIITDVNSRYQDFCHEFSDRKVYKLYESYLKSFKIQSLN